MIPLDHSHSASKRCSLINPQIFGLTRWRIWPPSPRCCALTPLTYKGLPNGGRRTSVPGLHRRATRPGLSRSTSPIPHRSTGAPRTPSHRSRTSTGPYLTPQGEGWHICRSECTPVIRVSKPPLQGIWFYLQAPPGKVYPCGSFFQDFSDRHVCHPSPWGVR